MAKTKRKAAADAAKEVAAAAERAAESAGTDDENKPMWPDVINGYHAPMVYPKGSLRRYSTNETEWIAEDQWSAAVELLEQGFVVAFSVWQPQAPDVACELARRCAHFRIGAAFEYADDGFSTVFFSKLDDGETVPPKRRKTKPGTVLEVH